MASNDYEDIDFSTGPVRITSGTLYVRREGGPLEPGLPFDVIEDEADEDPTKAVLRVELS